jgi:predicted nucleic acid-binding protein
VGLVLDSTVFIAAERRGLTARQTLAGIGSQFPGEQFVLSVITVIELAHGVARADTAIDGENAAMGVRTAPPDLLIGLTALELGYSVATSNLRHFETIPGLAVVSV